MIQLPKKIDIVEVGPRDGLQNESNIIPLDVKLEFIEKLANTGLNCIEATSFVSAKKIPQLSDHSELMQALKQDQGIRYPVLVPNLKGFENALASGAKEIAIFTAASESFCQKNINCSINESFQRFAKVMQAAKTENIPVRGYVSCVLGCPYEGEIDIDIVANVAKHLIDIGCYEVSLGDTIGIGTPARAQALFNKLLMDIPADKMAGHFHNTYGQALANILACMALGISTFDSSIAGLGGCPYAKGASGNVATEDLVYLCHGCGIETGVDLEKLVQVSHFITDKLAISPRSNLAQVQ